MIALTEPMGNLDRSRIMQGLNGALLYFRSQDGGSYGILTHAITRNGSAQFIGFSADNYAIAAQGETVVLLTLMPGVIHLL